VTIILTEAEGEYIEEMSPEAATALVTGGIAAAGLASAAWDAFKTTDTYASLALWTEERLASVFARVRWVEAEARVEIRGIDYPKLLARAERAYGNKGFANIFGRKYAFFRQLTYDWRWRKKLHPEDVSYISFHHFFALEAAEVFQDLAAVTGIRYYDAVAAQIWRRTWLARYADPPRAPPLPLAPAESGLRYTLKPYQAEFVASYPTLKARLDMRGVLLSFDQGLGKTLTAAALAECLGKERIYVVCPNSLRENWLGELRKYYARYDDPEVLRREVYVENMPGQVYSGKRCRWVVVNNEGMDKVMGTLADSRPETSMLIVDEGQNFRNPDGLRTKQLLLLRDRLGCDDVLPMSGTPIKASPSEIVPALLLLDRLFDADAARTYTKLFAMDDAAAARIVRARFGRVIYRKVKSEVLDLPPKTEVTLRMAAPDPDQYLLSTVRARITARFGEIYLSKLEGTRALVEQYRRLVLAHADGPASERDRYLRWVDNRAYGDGAARGWHELTVAEMEDYHARRIVPNLAPDERKAFTACYNQLIQMRQSAMGLAIGEILPKARRDLYLALWDANKATVIQRIRDNPNKTIIFTVFREVAERIHADVSAELGCVLVYGGTPNRQAAVDRFKNDDDVDCLVATSQTLSTGQTLTEADLMYFFGAPWRKADYDQASDRFHRIGQVNPVTVNNVVLDDDRPNLSSRMEEILGWSDAMFGAMIDGGARPPAARADAAAALAERAGAALAAGRRAEAPALAERALAGSLGGLLLEGRPASEAISELVHPGHLVAAGHAAAHAARAAVHAAARGFHHLAGAVAGAAKALEGGKASRLVGSLTGVHRTLESALASAEAARAAGLLDTAEKLLAEARLLAAPLGEAAAESYEVPAAAKEAARRGLELRARLNRGGTEVGVGRARQLISSKSVDAHTVKQMHAYFARHSVDKAGRGWDDEERPSAGKIAWLLWGGDAGKAWADSHREAMRGPKP
jgi:hypothetical protein